MRSHLNEMVTAAVICSAVILTLCPYAYSRSGLRCGDEFRIETQDGTTFQGKLLSNNGNLLALRHGASGLHTIALGDVASAFRVKRRTGTGILIGSVFGTGVGLIIAKVVDHNREHKKGLLEIPGEIEETIATFVLITLAGGIVGGSVGGIIGHSTQRLGPVQLEALPMCTSPSGNIVPIKINLAVNF